MRLLFEENREIYHDFVVRMFGVDDFDPGDSMTDSELGDQIISLHQQVIACKNSMRDTHALIEFASQLTRIITHLQDRLRGLLGRAKFAGELYQLICGLGFPEHVYSTLIRAASSSRNFENIIFYFSPETPSRRVAFKSPTTSPMYTPGKVVPYQKAKLLPTATPSRPRQQNGPKPPYHHANTSPPPTRIVNDSVLQVSSPLQEKSKRLEHFESAGISGPINNEDSLAPARPYLSPSDRALSILQLKPQSKQITAHLIATVLRSAILPIASEAWFYFWFVAVKNEDEERYLAGFYAKILKEAQNSEKVFEELMKALEDKTLGCLFDVQGYEHFRKAFPHLELFFNTPPNRSLTVWRLKQFVLSDQSVESPACLQRDYGFKFCRTREEVDRMKMLYTIMLQKVGPIVIHGHCIVNRLYEEGIIKTGIPMNAKDARLMKNDYPSSFLGYDNDLGLVAYRGPFFKRTLKI
ncbi:hypothetical protein T440DRAFT_464248 [Plenodomus tracheiphilus IPT5]|uniref:Uncharacterized protein n=1 Tax=Plenodomus tracheiphilus IPT5 TaxID=1408161 RepID=A0A6A7BHK6_9PLEO|nr:hypothetical protein T440DRAFT_464248 [Plenodomus tracheiphilus IPT5]